MAKVILVMLMSCSHGRMARGGHGLPKVLLGPAMLYYSMPFGQPTLKWPYGRYRGGYPHGRRPLSVLYPLGHPTLYAYACSVNLVTGSSWTSSKPSKQSSDFTTHGKNTIKVTKRHEQSPSKVQARKDMKKQ
jgi:hypothetical protein